MCAHECGRTGALAHVLKSEVNPSLEPYIPLCFRSGTVLFAAENARSIVVKFQVFSVYTSHLTV